MFTMVLPPQKEQEQVLEKSFNTQYHSTRTNTFTYVHTSATLYITTLLYTL